MGDEHATPRNWLANPDPAFSINAGTREYLEAIERSGTTKRSLFFFKPNGDVTEILVLPLEGIPEKPKATLLDGAHRALELLRMLRGEP